MKITRTEATKRREKILSLKAIGLLGGLLAVALLGFRFWNGLIVPLNENLSSFSLSQVIAFALIAGAGSFFSPCGLVLSPTLFSYNLRNFYPGEVKERKVLSLGLYSALGILSFYILAAIIISTIGPIFFPYLRGFQYLLALTIMFLGILVLRGINLKPFFSKAPRSFKNYSIFGFSYALALMGCCSAQVASTLIIFPFLAKNFTLGIPTFLTYGIAQAIMLTIFAGAMAFSEKHVLEKALSSSSEDKIKEWSGGGLILGGFLLLIYYLFFRGGIVLR